jgi:hypothetical protein
MKAILINLSEKPTTHSCSITPRRSKCKSSIGSYRRMISSNSIRRNKKSNWG